GGNVTLNAPAGDVGSAAPGGHVVVAVAGTLSSTSGAFASPTDGTYLSIIGPFSLTGIHSARSIDGTATRAINLTSSLTANHDGKVGRAWTGGGITINNTVTANGAGNVTLNAAQLLTLNQLVSSTSGNLTLIGGTGVTHSAGGNLTTGGAGTITVTATAN